MNELNQRASAKEIGTGYIPRRRGVTRVEGDHWQGTEGEGGLRVRASEEEDIANYDSLFWVLESK
jgi:hypothetical protein